MVAHSGPAIALFGLLALAGGMKVASPDLTSGALRAARLPHSRHIVRVLGLVELAVGIGGIVLGSAVPAMIAAALYAGFAWFVVNALRRGLPIASCGCFGAADTPPSLNHLVVNVAAVIVMVVAAVSPIGPWGGTDALTPWQAVAFVGFTGASIYLLYGVLAVLPMTQHDESPNPLRIVSSRSPQ